MDSNANMPPASPTAPMACTLSSEQMAGRSEEIERLAREGLVGRKREANRLVLRWRPGPEVEAAVRDLVRRERECCAFLRFELRHAADALELEIIAPPGGESILDALGSFGAEK